MATISAEQAKELKGYQFPTKNVEYTKRDVLLYNIGIGCTDLRFVYEGDGDFGVIPTYVAVMGMKGNHIDVVPFEMKTLFGGDLPFKVNPAMILHGENFTEFYSPVPLSGKFTMKSKLANVYDKGKALLIEMESVLYDSKNQAIAKDVHGIFVRGMGGFGGERGPSLADMNQPPSSPPDATVEYATTANQAHIYRLSGDYNPLHVDPGLAQMVGFEKPILHGLCSYGFAARAIIKSYCDNDPSKLKSIRVRFLNPVTPGDTLITKMWKDGPSRVIFQTLVKSSGKVVLTNSVAELHAGKASSGPAAAAPAQSASFKSKPVFEAMDKALKGNPALAEKVNAVFQFELKTASGTVVYSLDAKNKSSLGAKAGPASSKPDCTISMSDDDYFDLATGKLNAMQAFTSGKLKVSGNPMMAQKLNAITAQAKV